MADIFRFTMRMIDGTDRSHASAIAARFDPSTDPTAPQVRAAINQAIGP
jgi:hypothetical protein